MERSDIEEIISLLKDSRTIDYYYSREEESLIPYIKLPGAMKEEEEREDRITTMVIKLENIIND